jgi:hypothetical protein
MSATVQRQGGVAFRLVAVWLFVGCSANRLPSRSDADVAGTSTVSAGKSASSGTAGTTDNPTSIATSGAPAAGKNAAGSGGNGAAAVPSCVQAVQEAERVPVDMYIMLDRSASMLAVTGAGPSKWDATRNALTMFIRDSRSAGLGVGLQYFPIGREGVPTACTKDTDCGPGGPCLIRACRPPAVGSIPLILCLTANDCPIESPGCSPVGTCASDSSLFCFNIGTRGCGLGDACVGVESECAGFASCDANIYAQPAVPIGVLPGQAQALADSLATAMPLGRTPTSAALSGALARAKQQAMEQPTHRVIAVLATDGAPTECDPIDASGVGSIASQALMSSPAIQTYVIGVFTSAETEARANLNAWATAGGTSRAFIIDPGQDVAAQFLDALETIRSGSIACEYLLPPTPVGSQLDLDRVNVALVEAQRSRDFLYVGDESGCDRAPLGWHYDAAPASGKATKIVACSQACDALRATTGGRVEIRVGCKTMGPD